MLSSELKERGGQLIDELDLRRGSTTEKWMVHYVVELMQRAEHADSEEERLQAATRCADVIMRLWEHHVENVQRQLRSQVYSSFETVYKKRELSDFLRRALEAPSKQSFPRGWDARVAMLWHLLDVERDLLQLFIVAETLAHVEQGEIVDGEIQKFIKTEERVSTIRRHLNDVFPGIGDLDCRNRRSVLRRVKPALESIQALRERLI